MDSALADGDYRYAGFAITPAVFAELLPVVVSGLTMKRAQIADAVLTYHLERGGIPGTSAWTPIVKRGLNIATRDGTVAPAAGFGCWTVTGEARPLAPRPEQPTPVQKATNAETGRGAEYVYAYSYPSHAELAQLRGDDRWPHKVGMTRVSVNGRILDQVGTALPESPTIALVVETARAVTMERAFHAILAHRGRSLASAPGAEWFNTNPVELEMISAFLSDLS